MSSTERRRTLPVLQHIQDVLERRFKQAKEQIVDKSIKEQTYKITMTLIEDMMKESNEHMDYIKNLSAITQEDKDTILAKFKDFKSKLLGCQNDYNFKVQQAKIEQLSRSLSIKSEKCRGLEAKLSFLEEQLSEKHNNRQDIFLSVPLIIEAHVTGHPDNVCCFPFDKGYTCYEQLHKKVQGNFGLERLQWTEEDYRDAVESARSEQNPETLFHVMKINIKPSRDESENLVNLSVGDVDGADEKSPSEGQSDRASDGFSDLGDLQFPLVSVNPEVKLIQEKQQKQEKNKSYLDSIALKKLPGIGREVVDACTFHWTVWHWGLLKEKVHSNSFDAGGFEWNLSVNPSADGNDKHNVSIFLNLRKSEPTQCVHTEFILITSNPQDPTKYYCSSRLVLALEEQHCLAPTDCRMYPLQTCFATERGLICDNQNKEGFNIGLKIQTFQYSPPVDGDDTGMPCKTIPLSDELFNYVDYCGPEIVEQEDLYYMGNCSSMSYCDKETKTCQPKRNMGSPCTNNMQCYFGDGYPGHCVNHTRCHYRMDLAPYLYVPPMNQWSVGEHWRSAVAALLATGSLAICILFGRQQATFVATGVRGFLEKWQNRPEEQQREQRQYNNNGSRWWKLRWIRRNRRDEGDDEAYMQLTALERTEEPPPYRE
ncbi:hypothetical protein EC973_006134 [Apophysomyces ossiformis]|uniref:MATH domain-containing protein n=1 Tax=Apophysomyces ossiformis TaxID=679940 RepID=A0A8H7EUN3_9FUNG|nr:hypothetical protein EC973_006134 [Apophysomyces ossiformis]